MAERIRVRGIVDNGAAFMQSRREDGEWGLWQVGVGLRPWRADGGEIVTTGLYFSQATRLPHWLWHAAFLKRTIVELIVEPDPDRPDRARLIRHLGPRFDRHLRRAAADWLAGRVLEDPRFGRFTFDARTRSFDVQVDWLGNPVSLSLATGRTDQTPIEHARRIFKDAARIDAEARALAVAELLPLKNENWLGDDEVPLTPETFLSRIKLKTIGVESDDFYALYFDDDQMFHGHSITVSFDGETGESWATIEG